MLTSVPGASDYFAGGIIAYENEIKIAALAVDPAVIAAHGAVSEEVAAAMARGATTRLGTAWAVSTTGIAGPTGGSEEKPVGLVWIGLAGPDETRAFRHTFPGTRTLIRQRAAHASLNHLRRALLD
jgi:nicotinamide-nucleotide amidase